MSAAPQSAPEKAAFNTKFKKPLFHLLNVLLSVRNRCFQRMLIAL